MARNRASKRKAPDSPGTRVKRIRREQEMTQADLAKRANVNQGYLSSIERGDRSTVETIRSRLPFRVPQNGGSEHGGSCK